MTNINIQVEPLLPLCGIPQSGINNVTSCQHNIYPPTVSGVGGLYYSGVNPRGKALYIIFCLAMIVSAGCASLDKRLASDSEGIQKTAYSDFVRMNSREQDKFIDRCIKTILKDNMPQDAGVRYVYIQALNTEKDANIRALSKVRKIKASYIIDKMSDMDLWSINMLLTGIFGSPKFIDSLDEPNKKAAAESIKKLVDKLISRYLDYPGSVKKPVLNELFGFFGKISAVSLINNLKTAREKSDIWNNTVNMLGSLDTEVLASLDPKMYDDAVPLLINAAPVEPAGYDALSVLEKLFANDYVINKYTDQLEEVLKKKGLGYKTSMRVIGVLDKAGNKAKLGNAGNKLAVFKKNLKNELTKTIVDDVAQFKDIAIRLKAMEDVIKYQMEQGKPKNNIQNEVSQFNKYRDDVFSPALKKLTSELKDYSSFCGANELKDLAAQYNFLDVLEGLQL